MTRFQFEKRLEQHDWYYFMSDSLNVYNRGVKEEAFLQSTAQSNPEFKALYDAKVAERTKRMS